MYEERAIIFGRLCRHDKALELYVDRLDRPDKAEQYCAEAYANDPQVYLSLLKTYLPRDGRGTMDNNKALEVLRRHHERIDTTQALKLLPESTKIAGVKEFLVAVLRQQAAKRRDKQVLLGLAKTERLQVQIDLLRIQEQRIDTTEETLCFNCKKPIKTSAFAFYPNNIMVHLYCSREGGEMNPAICPCPNDNFTCVLKHSASAADVKGNQALHSRHLIFFSLFSR